MPNTALPNALSAILSGLVSASFKADDQARFFAHQHGFRKQRLLQAHAPEYPAPLRVLPRCSRCAGSSRHDRHRNCPPICAPISASLRAMSSSLRSCAPRSSMPMRQDSPRRLCPPHRSRYRQENSPPHPASAGHGLPRNIRVRRWALANVGSAAWRVQCLPHPTEPRWKGVLVNMGCSSCMFWFI